MRSFDIRHKLALGLPLCGGMSRGYVQPCLQSLVDVSYAGGGL